MSCYHSLTADEFVRSTQHYIPCYNLLNSSQVPSHPFHGRARHVLSKKHRLFPPISSLLHTYDHLVKVSGAKFSPMSVSVSVTCRDAWITSGVICLYTYVHIHAYTCIYMVYTCIHIHTYTHTHTVYTYAHTHTRIHIYIRTHTQTQTHMLPCSKAIPKITRLKRILLFRCACRHTHMHV
jgi:hypothetical protein